MSDSVVEWGRKKVESFFVFSEIGPLKNEKREVKMLFSNHISRFQSDPDTRIGKYFNESRCLATFKPYPLPMTTKKTSQGVRPSIISVPSRAPEFLFFFNSFFFSFFSSLTCDIFRFGRIRAIGRSSETRPRV